MGQAGGTDGRWPGQGQGQGQGPERRPERSPSTDGCASAWLPGGCSLPCFPRSDIQQEDVAAAHSSPPGMF